MLSIIEGCERSDANSAQHAVLQVDTASCSGPCQQPVRKLWACWGEFSLLGVFRAAGHDGHLAPATDFFGVAGEKAAHGCFRRQAGGKGGRRVTSGFVVWRPARGLEHCGRRVPGLPGLAPKHLQGTWDRCKWEKPRQRPVPEPWNPRAGRQAVELPEFPFPQPVPRQRPEVCRTRWRHRCNLPR